MAKENFQLFSSESGSQRGQVPLGDYLLQLIKENYDYLKKKYSFLRYINVFNRIDPFKASRYNVQVYVDFINDTSNRVTNDRNKIQIGKPEEYTDQPELSKNKTSGAQAIYTKDSITIGKVFHSEEIFGESFEYVLDNNWNRILSDNPFYVVCSDWTSKKPSFQSSPDLDSTLARIRGDIEKGEQKLEEKNEEFKKYYDLIKDDVDPKKQFYELFKQWLSNLRYCYSNDGETYNKTTHFFFFNGPIYYGDKKDDNSLADLVIDGNVGLTISNEREKIYARNFLHDFRQFITQASFNLLIEYMNEQLKETAVRASIAQVMARNMSHNFGSHVLSNLICNGVYDKLSDEKLREAEVNKQLKGFVSTLSPYDSEKNLQLPYFFQYLKSRMDYLSEVTFGVSNLLTTKMMYNDVMKELDQVRILLNYISGVSNFQYEFKLKYNKEVLTDQNDIGVAFPSDVLGCQAFYNIIENIIRNTAKHAKNNNGKIVTFTISIKDDFAKEVDCEDVKGVDELYCVEIDNGVVEDNIDVLVNGEEKDEDDKKKGQNPRLNKSVLEGQNLRSHSLGLLEMEASAAFLRQIDLPEIESDDYTVDYDDKYYHIDSKGTKRLNILKAFAIKEKKEDSSGHLGYRLFLQKPKEFLFVGDWKTCEQENEDEEKRIVIEKQEKAIRKQLLNCGIQFITEKEFCQAMEAEKAFAHHFLIYQEGISEDIGKYWKHDNDCKTLLPLRRLSISEDEWKTVSKEWSKLAQQDDQQNKSGDQDKKSNGKDILLQLKKWAWEKYIGNGENILIRGQLDPDSPKKQIVFLDHGKSFEDELKKRKKNINNGREVWIENLSSRTQGKLPRFVDLSIMGDCDTQLDNYINNITYKKDVKVEIFEAYRYRTIVLDERIQKFSNENFEGSSKDTTIQIPCSQLFETTDVLIPDTPLDPNSFSKESVEELERFMSSNITTDAFILVHYGVLERMYGEIDLIDGKLVEWATNARRVVVTSGRGAHSLKLPNKVCFVNLSSALYAFCENRNKYIINNLLNQARRKRNE